MAQVAEKIPPKLYRFRSLDSNFFYPALRKAVNGRCIYMAPLSAQNDPFEAKPKREKSSIKEVREFMCDFEDVVGKGISFGGMNLAEEAKARGIRAKDLKKFFGTSVEAARRIIAVNSVSANLARNMAKLTCFSAKWDSLLMWSHYCSGHNGVCLEYSTDPAKMEQGTPMVLSVRYQAQRPAVTTVETLKFLASSSHRDKVFPSIDKSEVQETFEKAFMTKSMEWSYEEEWRAMVMDENPAGYRFAPGLRVERILLGINVSAENEAKIVAEFGEAVEVERVSLCKSEFALKR